MEYIKMFYCFALFLILGTSVRSDSVSTCEREKSNTFLDIASDMIKKAKTNMPSCSQPCEIQKATQEPTDCLDVLKMGNTKNGVYTVRPITRLADRKPLKVYCDMQTDGGGWTVIQRRGNFGRPIDDFFRNWSSYKEGFGDIEKDFWLGNDNIFAFANQKLQTVRFDLQDVQKNKAYAKYDSFWIDDEYNSYTLHIYNYSGNAGDSMVYHNYRKFSTKDVRNDDGSFGDCAQKFKGGWWYKECHHANLNGLYRRGKHNDNKADGVSWLKWKGDHESMESTEIKIRPQKH